MKLRSPMGLVGRSVAVFLLISAVWAQSARAQVPAASITSIDTKTGLVNAKVNATGQQFQFTLTNAAQIKTLRIEQPVYANFASRQISLDGQHVAGQIVSVSPGRAARGAGTNAGQAALSVASSPQPPCCSITAIDTDAGVIAAKVNATEAQFEFTPSNPAQLSSLQVGQTVYANFATGQVSLDGQHPAGQIIRISPIPHGQGTSGMSSSASAATGSKNSGGSNKGKSGTATKTLTVNTGNSSQMQASEGDTAMAIRGIAPPSRTAAGRDLAPASDKSAAASLEAQPQLANVAPTGTAQFAGTPISGTFSPSSENVRAEADPAPLVFSNVANTIKTSGQHLQPLALTDAGKQIIQVGISSSTGLDFQASLLSGHKYMVNNCLGIKASAGNFDIQIPVPELRFDNAAVTVKYQVSRINMNALSIRLRPDLGDPLNMCSFSGRIGIGGYAEDVQYTVSFNPILDLESCRLASVGDLRTNASVGTVRIEPLPPEVGAVAKNMINDALLLLHTQQSLKWADWALMVINRLLAENCPVQKVTGG